MMKRLFFPLFAGLLWLMSGTLSATERTYNVLFIQSYTKNTPWHSLLTENLENGLDKGGVKANITTEYLKASSLEVTIKSVFRCLARSQMRRMMKHSEAKDQ